MKRNEILKPGEYVGIPKSLMAVPNKILPASAKLVYGAIIERFGENDHAWPGFGKIAKDTGLCRRQVIHSVKLLSTVGLLVIDQTDNHQSNTYWCNNCTSAITALVQLVHRGSAVIAPLASAVIAPGVVQLLHPNYIMVTTENRTTEVTTEDIALPGFSDSPNGSSVPIVAPVPISLVTNHSQPATNSKPQSERSENPLQGHKVGVPGPATVEPGTTINNANPNAKAVPISAPSQQTSTGADRPKRASSSHAQLTSEQIAAVLATDLTRMNYLRAGSMNWLTPSGGNPTCEEAGHLNAPQIAGALWYYCAWVRQANGLVGADSLPSSSLIGRVSQILKTTPASTVWQWLSDACVKWAAVKDRVKPISPENVLQQWWRDSLTQPAYSGSQRQSAVTALNASAGQWAGLQPDDEAERRYQKQLGEKIRNCKRDVGVANV